MIQIDTDICIALLKGNTHVLANRKRYGGTVGVSFMTVAELYFGAYKSKRVESNLLLVEQFLLTVTILPSSIEVLQSFGSLKARLETSGNRLADADLLVAASALIHCEALVTGNIRHFNRIPNLQLENWLS